MIGNVTGCVRYLEELRTTTEVLGHGNRRGGGGGGGNSSNSSNNSSSSGYSYEGTEFNSLTIPHKLH